MRVRSAGTPQGGSIGQNGRMRPATVVTIAILLLALFAAGIYQLMTLPDSETTETTVAIARTLSSAARTLR